MATQKSIMISAQRVECNTHYMLCYAVLLDTVETLELTVLPELD